MVRVGKDLLPPWPACIDLSLQRCVSAGQAAGQRWPDLAYVIQRLARTMVGVETSVEARLREVIESRMQARRWRKADLARRAGISESQVGRLLRGERRLTADMVERIADAFGITATLLREEAGVLTVEERRRLSRPSLEVHIDDDPRLSDDAKEALKVIYRDLVRRRDR